MRTARIIAILAIVMGLAVPASAQVHIPTVVSKVMKPVPTPRSVMVTPSPMVFGPPSMMTTIPVPHYRTVAPANNPRPYYNYYYGYGYGYNYGYGYGYRNGYGYSNGYNYSPGSTTSTYAPSSAYYGDSGQLDRTNDGPAFRCYESDRVRFERTHR